MNSFRIFIFFVLVWHINQPSVKAQTKKLYLNHSDSSLFVDTFIEFSQVEKYIQTHKILAIQNGFLEYDFNSIQSFEDSISISATFGPKTEKIELEIDSESSRILGLQNTKLQSSLSPDKIKSYLFQILKYWENRGYPFVSAKLSNVYYSESMVYAKILVEKGKFFTYDTLEIIGNAKLSSKFLMTYLNIKPNQIYNEENIKDIEKKLRSLSFITPSKPTTIQFIGNKAKPILYLNQRNNDLVDGIIGMAPNNNTTLGNPRFLLTGEFKIKLSNLFQSAKTFNLNWRSFRERSQELNIQSQLPFLMGSNLGADFSMYFLKYDTLFTQLQFNIGATYHYAGMNKIKFYYQIERNSLITIDTQAIKSQKKLPTSQAININTWGIENTIDKLNYPFNPSKGYKLVLNVGIGKKSILKDIRIQNLVIENNQGEKYSLYDSIETVINRVNFNFNFDKFFDLGKKNVLRTNLYGQGLITPTIYFNELYRFGGVYSLRGFNEQSIFASTYSILNIEYRYLLNKNSNLLLFWNGAWYENRSIINSERVTDTPYGFGIGANIETGAGIFTFAYALGKEFNNSINLQTGKIHFGISALF